MRQALSLAALLALTGCLIPVPGDYGDVLPDERIQINLPVAFGDSQRDREWSQFYLLTARVTDDVNGLIGFVLHTVDVVTDLPPTWHDTEDNTAVWGPFADALDPVQTVLWVHYDEETDVYTWVIAQRPKTETSDEAWVHIIGGQVDAGATTETSSGWFAIDFDAAHDLDPNQTATGSFGCEYDIAADGVKATAGFEDFSDGDESVDAYYHYEQLFAGSGKMDLAIEDDINGNLTEEILVVRSRWEYTGAGRSDGYVTGGDLGALVATVSECWDETFAPVFYEDNFSGNDPEGDEALCVYDEPEYNENDEL